MVTGHFGFARTDSFSSVKIVQRIDTIGHKRKCHKMDIMVLIYHSLVSCLVIFSGQFSYLDAKTVSLNELIAAESRASLATHDPLIAEESRTSIAKEQATHRASTYSDKAKRISSKKSSTKPLNKLKRKNSDLDTGASTLKELLANQRRQYAEKSQYKLRAKNSDKSAESERFSLNKFLFRDKKKPREFEITELISPRGKKLLSSLKYKKKFQIQSPLKPKKLSYLQKPRQKLKSQSVKRQVYNERFNRQYIPLLKSLSMLFDNMLNPDVPDSREANEDGDEGIDDLVPGASQIEPERVRNSKNETHREFIKSRQTKNAKLRESIRNYLRNKSNEGRQSNKVTESKNNKERTTGKEKNNNSFRYKTNTTSSENKSHESDENKLKDVKETNKKENENETNTCTCSCATKTNFTPAPPKEEEAINTTTVVTEVPTEQTVQTEAASTTTDITTPSNIINLRQDQNISAVSPGNSSSLGRDVSGLGEGSSATLHGSTEGDISRNNGDSQYHPGSRENKPNAKDDAELANSYTRERPNGRQPGGTLLQDAEVKSPVYRGHSYKVEETQNEEKTSASYGISRNRGSILRNLAVIPIYRGDTFELEETQVIEEDVNGTRRDITEFKRDDIIEIGEDAEQSASTISEPIRLRGHVFKDSVSVRTKPLRSEEDHEKGVDSITRSVASDKRFFDGDGAFAAEVKEAGAADETIITVEDLADPVEMLKPGPQGKTPFVTIIDGYSVARDINGKNKWEEQSIHYHTR